MGPPQTQVRVRLPQWKDAYPDPRILAERSRGHCLLGRHRYRLQSKRASRLEPHSVLDASSDHSAACVRLYKELRAHKRPIMVLGGEAALWNMPEGWNVMVRQLILICRSHGVMVIDGVHYYRRMRKCWDGWHIAKTTVGI
jgi:hypothetical protein